MSKKIWGLLTCSENLDEDVKMYESLFGLAADDEWNGCRSFTFEEMKFYVMSAPEAAPLMVLQVQDIEMEIARLRSEGFEVMDPFDVRMGRFTFYQDGKGINFGLLQPAKI